MKTETNDWPHWLPKSSNIAVNLTNEQLGYILPVFNAPPRSSCINGLTLCDGRLCGQRTAFKTFLNRFRYSDIDVSNIIEATQP